MPPKSVSDNSRGSEEQARVRLNRTSTTLGNLDYGIHQRVSFGTSNDQTDETNQPLLWNYPDDSDNEISDDEWTQSSLVTTSQRHYKSTAAICLCTFTHSWLLVSVFPYAGFMVIKLVAGTTEENAGSYAGLLSAAFMIGRVLTSYGWGKISDTYGRRIVLFLSLILSAIFSVCFGMSSSFWTAFFWRFLLGASNGVAGISKAIVSETAHGNDILETRGMSLTMGMWAWGFLFSPGISGFLSDPLQQYQQLDNWLSHDGFIYATLKRYPFIIPNLISVGFCIINVIAVEMCVPETLPKEDFRSPSLILSDSFQFIRKLLCANALCQRLSGENRAVQERMLNDPSPLPLLAVEANVVKQARMNHSESVSLLSTSSPYIAPTRHSILLHANHQCEENVQEKATLVSLWAIRDTRNQLMLYWIFSFVAIAIDEAFPLFCISKTGGLGISASAIGKLLSATGLVFALSQYHVYAWIVEKYGLHRSIQIGAFLSAPLILFVPFSLPMNRGGKSNEEGETNILTWSAFLYLSLVLAVCRVFGLVFFSSITIATNRTVIPCHRGTMNGLSMLGGSFAKGLGPIFAGWLTTFAISSGTFAPQMGATVVFIVIGLLATVTACMTLVMVTESATSSECHGGGDGTPNDRSNNAG